MERNYKALFETTNDAIFLLEADHCIDCNPAALDMFGCERNQIIGQSLLRFSSDTQSDDQNPKSLLLDKIAKALTGKPQRFEWSCLRWDNSPLCGEISLNGVDYSGKPYVLATIRDITSRKVAEQSLAEQTAILRAWFDTVPGVTMKYDTEGRLVNWNRRFADFFGDKPEEIDKQDYLKHVAPAAHAKARGVFDETINTGHTQSVELPMIKSGGAIVTVLLQLNRYFRNGRPHVVEVGIDVTERVSAEQEARRQKEALRKLTRRLIHSYEEERRHISRELHDEMGQSLTAVRTDAMTIANIAKDKLPEIHERAQSILKMAGQTYDMAHRIMKRLRPSALYDLGLIDALEDLLEEWRKKDSSTQFILSVSGEFNDLEDEVSISIYRIIQECITNAVRHSGGTSVTIKMSRVLTIDPNNENRELIHLLVTDNGIGLVDEIIGRKDSFGLAGIRERAQSLGGELMIHNAEDKGLSIEVILPILPAPTHSE